MQWNYGYDPANQLTRAVKTTADATPVVLQRFGYGYDAAANRTVEQIDDAVAGATHNALNELVSQQPSGALTFAGAVSEPSTVTIAAHPAAVTSANAFRGSAIVPVGTSTVAVAATDASGNTTTQSYQVTQSGASKTLTYDANGNLTSDGSRTLVWDAADRLLSVTIGTHVSSFTYDGRSRRVRIVETEGGVLASDQQFVWCGATLCEQRTASGGAVVKRFFAEGVEDGGNHFFYSRDHLGSVRELTDDTGATRARYAYGPWGKRTKEAGDSESVLGFTGSYLHSASGLTFALYRAYDTDLGRWISEDPIGFAGGANFYGYVAANSVRYVDPLGWALTSVDAEMRNAILRGNLNEIQILLNDTGQSLSSGMRQAAELAIENQSTTAGGEKSAAELAKHIGYVSSLEDQAAALRDALEDAATKAKRKIVPQLEETLKDLKGYLKEMAQKWGDICSGK